MVGEVFGACETNIPPPWPLRNFPSSARQKERERTQSVDEEGRVPTKTDGRKYLVHSLQVNLQKWSQVQKYHLVGTDTRAERDRKLN